MRFKLDFVQSIKDFLASNLDPFSMHQVSKIVKYFDDEKTKMFDYLCIDPQKSHWNNVKIHKEYNQLL